jgi:hypothetical protein
VAEVRVTIPSERMRTGEVLVTTRNVNKQASALAKARERRRELDKARDEQDRRVEHAGGPRCRA